MCVGRGEAPSEPRCRLVNHFLYLLLDPRSGKQLGYFYLESAPYVSLPSAVTPANDAIAKAATCSPAG